MKAFKLASLSFIRWATLVVASSITYHISVSFYCGLTIVVATSSFLRMAGRVVEDPDVP